MVEITKKPASRATAFEVMKSYGNGAKYYWYLFVLTFFCIVISSVVQVTVPLFYKQFFDILSSGGNRAVLGPELIGILLKVLGLNAIIWLSFRIASFSDNYSQSKTSVVLKQQAFDYLVDHSYSFFANSFGGTLVQRINRHVRAFGTLADQVTWSVLPLAINIVGIFIVLLRIKPIFAWVILIWAFVFLLFNFFFSRFKTKYDVISAEADSKASGYLADVITNHTNVQLFASHEYESEGFNTLVWDQTRKAIFSWNLAGVVDAVQASLIFILEFFIFYFAVHYWQQGFFTVGTFVLLQAYILGLGDRLWGFSRIIRALYESFSYSKEMVDIMLLSHEIKNVPNAQKLNVEKGEIVFKDLSFNFNETRPVLSAISLTIHSGEKVALIGPSGAGKSTFVRLLLRLYETTGGTITIDGQDIKDVTQESLREHVSLVPQDPVLFHRSLKENIRYGKKNATDEEVLRAAKLAHCDEFIKDLPLGYDTFVGERGIKLSGGERQRVAIARAILKNAPILILDEATSSLDSHSEALIQDALSTLMRGKTVIVIAHRLSTIRKMDRIIVIDNGAILEEGTHDSLLQKPGSLYKKLWELQAGGFIQEIE